MSTLELPDASDLAAWVTAVTHPMVGVAFEHCEALPDHDPDRYYAHSAMVPIQGEHSFVVALSSDEAGCTLLASIMFACTAAEVDSEMRDDALGELANITAGVLKRRIATQDQIALPIIRRGDDLPSSFRSAAWKGVPMQGDACVIVVSITTDPKTVEECRAQ